MAYAAVQLDGALVTAAYGDPSPVSDDQLSFRWDGATGVTTSLVWGRVAGAVRPRAGGLRLSGALSRRHGRLGVWTAVIGSSLHVLAHAASVAFRSADIDEPGGVVALSLFGLGTVLTAAGFLLAGADVRRSGRWTASRRGVAIKRV